MGEKAPVVFAAAAGRGGEHPERHEPSRVNVRALSIVAGAIVATAIFVHVGVYFLFGVYSRDQAERPVNRARTAVVGERAVPPPGVPRLQGIPGFHAPTPSQDMEALRAANDAELGSYGPGGAPGYFEIPVARAMELALERGLFPTRERMGRPEGGGDHGR